MFGRNKADKRARRRLAPAEPASSATYKVSGRTTDTAADNTGRQRPGQRPETRKKPATPTKQLARRAGALILTVAIIISVISALTVTPQAKIAPMTAAEANSPVLRDQAEYQAAADRLLTSSILNRNKITINTGQINREMMKRFPELASVSTTLPLLGHRPTVYLQPAQASLVIAANNGAFVIDQTGRALMPSANLPTASKLPQIVDQSGLQIRTDSQVLSDKDVAFIRDVTAQLSAKKVEVSSMVLPASSRELDVYIAGKPYFVKFNLQNNTARQQAGTYLATVAQLQRQNVKPARYIDVRVDGRAYYQ